MTLRLTGLATTNAKPLRIHLPGGEVVGLRPARGGVTVEVWQGRAWVTQDGDPADYLLAPGELFQTASRRRVVVQALGETSFAMRSPSGRTP